MQTTRTFIRSPQVCRIVRAPAATQNMSHFAAPSFFGRLPTASYPTIGSELAPFFRMIDDFTTGATRALDQFTPPPRHRTFEPRFDVREVGQTYELRGELPGVESKDLEVEFTDGQTLVIRGRTESESASGAASASSQAVEAATEPTPNTQTVADNSDDAASTYSTGSYQKPTVEEENAAEASATSTPGHATPAESTTSEAAPQQQPTVQITATPEVSQQAQAATPRYWVSERSTGSFERVFRFPARVNQDGVSASLKNGILNVVVPKAVVAGSRRIVVE